MAFSGFADAQASFFRKLAQNQRREWFEAHRDEFEQGWRDPMQELLAEVAGKLDPAFKHCDLDPPKLFRIFRDVRFSADKSPYKTHIGGVIPTRRAGKLTEVPIALYFHVGEPRSFAAAGHYMMDSHSLQRFRTAVADEQTGPGLEKLLRALAKKGYSIDSHDTYKRVPKGYAADHRRAEHLKRKGLTVSFPEMPKGLLASPELVAWLVKHAKAAVPLVEWLVFATQ
jgi:uncharacterized protein (TIGR02453 family)